MAKQILALSVDSAVVEAAQQRASAEGRDLREVAQELLAAYAEGKSTITLAEAAPPAPAKPKKPSPPPAPQPPTPEQDDADKPKSGLDAFLAKRKAAQRKSQSAPQTAQSDPCAPIPGASFAKLSINGQPTDRTMDTHGDINAFMRTYDAVSEDKKLIGMSGATDANAPQLTGLFADGRTPAIKNVYRVHKWDWNGVRPQADHEGPYPVHVAGVAVKPGEILRIPGAGYEIAPGGFVVLVLFANATSLTLKYTREDSVVDGYTLHLDDACPDPALLQLFNQLNGAGRRELPALKAGQEFARCRSDELKIIIRDKGSFMDPRSRKDWW